MSTNYLSHSWRQTYNMSNKNMTITDISKSSKQFKDTHTIQVSGFKNGGRVTVADVLLEMRKGFAQINSRINKVELNLTIRIDKLESRIDNLVAKNNLKES